MTKRLQVTLRSDDKVTLQVTLRSDDTETLQVTLRSDDRDFTSDTEVR